MIKYFSICAVLFSLFSCKKETENYAPLTSSDYYPLEAGKYITYNLDSTVYYRNFGKSDSVIHYQVQDRVDAQITDNLGRPAYRIIRYMRKHASESWAPANTFIAVKADNSIEYVENNLRFIKLQSPVAQDFSWKGNSFVDTYSNYTDLKYLDDWDYLYDSVNVPLTINSLTYDSTIKVSQRDEFLGQDPSIPGTLYAEKNYSVEKYAKGIGLIYKEFLHWEYQGVSSPSPGYTGYGVTLSIIDHN